MLRVGACFQAICGQEQVLGTKTKVNISVNRSGGRCCPGALLGTGTLAPAVVQHRDRLAWAWEDARARNAQAFQGCRAYSWVRSQAKGDSSSQRPGRDETSALWHPPTTQCTSETA